MLITALAAVTLGSYAQLPAQQVRESFKEITEADYQKVAQGFEGVTPAEYAKFLRPEADRLGLDITIYQISSERGRGFSLDNARFLPSLKPGFTMKCVLRNSNGDLMTQKFYVTDDNLPSGRKKHLVVYFGKENDVVRTAETTLLLKQRDASGKPIALSFTIDKL